MSRKTVPFLDVLDVDTAPAGEKNAKGERCGACAHMSEKSKFGYYHSCFIYEARAVRPEDDIDCPAFQSRSAAAKQAKLIKAVKGLCKEAKWVGENDLAEGDFDREDLLSAIAAVEEALRAIDTGE